METPPDSPAPFARSGPWPPASPLIVSVPHAGREYPPDLLARCALPPEALRALEDRHADALADGLPALGLTIFVARRARAWIDLNRDPREIDPAMVQPSPPMSAVIASTKVRGGLGLIPRRIAGAGEIMWQRLPVSELAARIEHDHHPWHAGIADALAAARARFGVALLLDLHSMPPLAAGGGQPPARMVIGDRHGRSAASRLVATALAAAGPRAARNAPYAGGYTLDRHGRPAEGTHAIQLEVDRGLYLAPDLLTPGDGLPATRALVETIARALMAALRDVADPAILAAG